MCVVKTPKIKNATDPNNDKPLPILRNPLLDGINPMTNSLRIGRDNLRLDLAQAPTAATAPSTLRINGSGG